MAQGTNHESTTGASKEVEISSKSNGNLTDNNVLHSEDNISGKEGNGSQPANTLNATPEMMFKGATKVPEKCPIPQIPSYYNNPLIQHAPQWSSAMGAWSSCDVRRQNQPNPLAQIWQQSDLNGAWNYSTCGSGNTSEVGNRTRNATFQTEHYLPMYQTPAYAPATCQNNDEIPYICYLNPNWNQTSCQAHTANRESTPTDNLNFLADQITAMNMNAPTVPVSKSVSSEPSTAAVQTSTMRSLAVTSGVSTIIAPISEAPVAEPPQNVTVTGEISTEGNIPSMTSKAPESVPDEQNETVLLGQPKKNKESTVEILPQALVDGAINVAASAYSTAWNALNNLRPKETTVEYDPVFENNMALLIEMGFRNIERNALLLKQYNNDLNQVIGIICATPPSDDFRGLNID